LNICCLTQALWNILYIMSGQGKNEHDWYRFKSVARIHTLFRSLPSTWVTIRVGEQRREITATRYLTTEQVPSSGNASDLCGCHRVQFRAIHRVSNKRLYVVLFSISKSTPGEYFPFIHAVYWSSSGDMILLPSLTRDSSVGIATGYGLDGPGIESR
jgi:hypothetical protein